MVESLKGKGSCKGSLLSYAWGKVREHDTLIFFNLSPVYNFIFTKLTTKLGVHDFEMGEVVKANGAFKEQEV